ncbi:S8 family serine peptidase [Polymorphobacter sp. PAMC 29334]|uniref:S8 family peptidase n=1 Tax=Polymorphobacter sp. PAMC 29334 TaxID=2862331 RepID=UPI001C762009|nr:S8 family peptidase [Polymorphobacter sp. PAMC 29334]QYE36258.1 S8 family serine peptidase [Polymorphobacter sp. PAMC 29334]
MIASPRPAARSVNDTAEYRANYNSYELIGALYAADAGLTGKGVTVGIVDGGFTTSDSELAGRQSALSKDFGNILTKQADGSYAATARNDIGLNPSSLHGAIVAELLAANRDGQGSVGVAPQASVALLRIDDSKTDMPNADGSPNEELSGANIAAAINYAASVKIPVLSVSLGIDGGASPSLTAAINRFASVGGLFVIAAGNSGSANPESIQLVSSANRGSWISVGGLSNSLTAFTLDPSSGQAGTLADRYITAPYDNIAADPANGGGFYKFTGTSGAVPLVAATAALILQKWPQLSGKDAGNVILATARDIGAPGTDPVFGRGLLDIKAALSPVDPVLVTQTGTTTPIASASLALPSATGTGSITKLLSHAVILDAFGRDFTADARGIVRSSSNIGAVAGLTRTIRRNTSGTLAFSVTSDIEYAGGPVREGEPVARLAGTEIRVRTGGTEIAFTQGYAPWTGSAVAGLGAPSLALAAYAGAVTTGARTIVPFGDGALTFDAGTGGSRAVRNIATASVDAAGVGWSNGRWSLGGGVISENGAVFGSRSTGALQLASATTTGFGEARYIRLAGRWSFTGYGSIGVTALRDATNSLLTAPSTLVTSRFGIEAGRNIGIARVTVGVAQPLNVESGGATLTLGNGYDLDSRSLTFAANPVDLRGNRQFLAQAEVDFGLVRIGFVQGMRRPETGVVTSMGWHF